ncbi:hypothetical protein LSTR_LSTR001796 [Laodelphax striatellus]|uniref:Uncharacterized protein n=1 Tax=Laodelphax striatellus TaxID=195883 RepID=A0A482WGB2_LAOST|nr:hypothetical protein LSTR_LSTR001796 [Laodelphax striatellus]
MFRIKTTFTLESYQPCTVWACGCADYELLIVKLCLCVLAGQYVCARRGRQIYLWMREDFVPLPGDSLRPGEEKEFPVAIETVTEFIQLASSASLEFFPFVSRKQEIIDKMSDTRRWTRPRTRVYDCNYNLGEQYYKPVVDSLDRKYGGGIAERLAADEPISRRSPFESSSSSSRDRASRAEALMDAAEEEFDVGASLQRLKASRAARQELEDEMEAMSTERMMKKKAAMGAAARESLLEDELESALSGGRRRKANYSEQLLDTVGVNGKLHDKLVDEVSTFRRKAQSAIDDFNEELTGRTENSRRLVNLARQRADLLGSEEHAVVTVRVKKVPRLTKWTALNATSMTESLEESSAEKSARARARASKARLADLDAEMEALAERGQQREMRVKGLRSMLAESASSATSVESTSSMQVEQHRKRERKVNF